MEQLYILLGVNLLLLALLLGGQPGLRIMAHGIGYALSSLDAAKPMSTAESRLKRVKDNQIETVVLLVPVVWILVSNDVSSSAIVTWSWVLLAARFAYVGVAMVGVPILRSAIWFAGFVAWAMLAIAAARAVL